MARFEELGIDFNNARTAGEIALGGIAVYLGYKSRLWKRRFFRAEDDRKREPKTNLLTYPAFLEEVKKRTSSTKRQADTNREHGLILVDLDDFKRWNTQLTHPVADEEALLPAARTLEKSVRPVSDLVCRFGGEEFLVFLSDAHPEGVEAYCHRIQYRGNSIEPGGNPLEPLGLTLTHATFRQGEDFEMVIKDLSSRLNEAKKVPGKNQIVGLQRERILAE